MAITPLKDEDQHVILESWTMATIPAKIYFHSEIHTNVWHRKGRGSEFAIRRAKIVKSMSCAHDFVLVDGNSCIDMFPIDTWGQRIHMKLDSDGSILRLPCSIHTPQKYKKKFYNQKFAVCRSDLI